jgi:hypothetical protein
MSANPDDAGTASAIGALLTILHEEVNASARPRQFSRTILQPSRAAKLLLQH